MCVRACPCGVCVCDCVCVCAFHVCCYLSLSSYFLLFTGARNYLCRKCGQSMRATGHSQYFGQRYCPNAEELPFEDWRKEAEERRRQKKKENP